MKYTFIVLLLSAGVFISCSSEDRSDTEHQNPDPTKTEEPAPTEPDQYPIIIGPETAIHILFTDSNNVSVFDRNGYSWSIKEILNYCIVDGEEILVNNANEHILLEYPNGIMMEDPEFPNWVLIGLDYTFEQEDQTTLLKFPDKSVDTLYWQMGISYYNGMRTGNSIQKLWYNGELKYDIPNPSLNPEIFPDGRKRVDKEFHIIK